MAPLAVELVREGVAMVVGMNGKVADGACRLFSRQFYRALLEGRSVVEATTRGRRAALRSWRRLLSGIDWALPAVYQAAGQGTEALDSVTIDPVEAVLKETAYSFAKELSQQRSKPQCFCDRFDVLEARYHELVDDEGAGAKQILFLEVLEPDQGNLKPQYGKSRTLYELATKSARDGHIPLVLGPPLITANAWNDDPPESLLAFAVLVRDAVIELRTRYNCPRDPSEFLLTKVIDRVRGTRVSELPAPIVRLLEHEVNPIDSEEKLRFAGRLLAKVVAADLDQLVGDPALQTGREVSKRLVILLIDNFHRWAGLVPALARAFFIPGGELMRSAGSVRAVFTASMSQSESGGQAINPVVDSFKELFTMGHLRRQELGRFYKPNEDPVPYTQFLLLYEPPLVVSGQLFDKEREVLMKDLFGEVDGIPSQLEVLSSPESKSEMRHSIRTYSNPTLWRDTPPWLQDANDEKALEGLAAGAQPATGGD
jgi:hypothetical protein